MEWKKLMQEVVLKKENATANFYHLGTDQLASKQDDFNNRPCVGLCYYRKLNGIVVDKKKMAERRARQPCIGMCYRERKKKAKERRRMLKLLQKGKKKKATELRNEII